MPYIGNPIYQSAFVTDQFSGDGSTTAFTMSVAPAGVTNVLVAVSGVLQDPSTYGVTGPTITFSTAPPSGTGHISCRYLGIPVTGVTTTAYRTVTEFTATASQTTFTPPSYTVGYINVYRNGVLLGSADYTATNGTTVVLASGATAGDIVTVESFRVESVLNAISNSAGSVGTNNIADNAITTAKIAAGAVVPADLSTGGPSWDTSSNLTVAGQASLGTGQADYIAAIGGAGTGRVEVVGSNTNVNLALSTKGTGSVYFWSGGYGGTNTMLIDSSGRVTMPFQPAFSARGSGSTPNTAGATLQYATVDVNIGSCYNGSTYRFTAPVAGIYRFSFNCLFNAPTYLYASLYKNGANTNLGSLGCNQGGGVEQQSSCTVVVSASANDFFDVRIWFFSSGYVGLYNGHSVFSGELIS